MTTSVDPSALLVRVQRGDRAAFSALYDELAPLVFGAVARVVRDRAIAEEVTQEVFVELWKTADRFDPARAKASTWAVTIARRRAVDRVRHEQSHRNRNEAEGHGAQPAATDPADAVTAIIDAERVEHALRQLPDDQQQVIRLAFLDGLSHGAIAAQLGIPLGTVKGRVRAGLKRLRGLIGTTP